MPKSTRLQQILNAIPKLSTAMLRKCLNKDNKQIRMAAYAELTRRRNR